MATNDDTTPSFRGFAFGSPLTFLATAFLAPFLSIFVSSILFQLAPPAVASLGGLVAFLGVATRLFPVRAAIEGDQLLLRGLTTRTIPLADVESCEVAGRAATFRIRGASPVVLLPLWGNAGYAEGLARRLARPAAA